MMLEKILFILLFFCIVRYGKAINGGENATDNVAPYRVSLKSYRGDGTEFHYAEGSIISENKILCSAAIMEGISPDNLTAVVGMQSMISDDKTQKDKKKNKDLSSLIVTYKEYFSCIIANAIYSSIPFNFYNHAKKYNPLHLLNKNTNLNVSPVLLYSCDIILNEEESESSEGEQRHKIASIIIHEDYNHTSFVNDISVLYITDKFKFNSRVQPIGLAKVPREPGDKCLTVGAGAIDNHATFPDTLQMITSEIISLETCNVKYRRAPTVLPITDAHVCVVYSKDKGQGICKGDAGAAIVNKNEIVGVTSFVIPCGKGYPDVFTNVTHYLDWIESH